MHDFIKPANSEFVRFLSKLLFPCFMTVKHPGTRLRILGDGLKRFKMLDGQRVVVLPNHPDHDDPETIFQFSQMVGEDFNYLTAHEVFHGNHGLNRLLQYLGCYSVMRGTADHIAFRVTQNLILEGKRKVVIFPEGEVSHQGNRLLPLKSGGILIAFSALEKLKRRNCQKPILLLPLAIRYTYLHNISCSLVQRIQRLELKMGVTALHRDLCLERLQAVLLQVVSNLERQYDIKPDLCSNLDNRIAHLRLTLLHNTASYLHLQLPAKGAQLDWAHLLQSTIYDKRFHQNRHVPPFLSRVNRKQLRQLRNYSKAVYRAINSLAMYDSCLRAPVTQEQASELIGVLEEELFGKSFDNQPRAILIAVGQPIDISDYYDRFTKNKDSVVNELEEHTRIQLSAMLEEIDKQRSPVVIGSIQDSAWNRRRTVISKVRSFNSDFDGKPRRKWNQQTVLKLNDKAILEILRSEALIDKIRQSQKPDAQS